MSLINLGNVYVTSISITRYYDREEVIASFFAWPSSGAISDLQ